MNRKKIWEWIEILLCAAVVFCLAVLAAAAVQFYTGSNGTSDAVEIPEPVDRSTANPQESALAVQASKDKVTAELNDLITGYLNENDVDMDCIGVAVHDLKTDAEYCLNESELFVAASTYKLPLAVYYYEQINANHISSEISIPYSVETVVIDEEGNETVENTTSYASIQTLLHRAIVYSDNSAAEGLYNYLGGWGSFKDDILQYSDTCTSDQGCTASDNRFTAAYMNDLLQYIVERQDSFSVLIEDMAASMPDSYLNHDIGDVMAQKYGSYGNAVNAVGFSLSGHPYTIAVFTALPESGESLIGELNALCWNYFNA